MTDELPQDFGKPVFDNQGNRIAAFTVMTSDMDADKQASVAKVIQPLHKNISAPDKDLAGMIKTAIEGALGTGWQVIVGQDFGTTVCHAPGSLLFAYFGNKAVLCFKSS